ncbi:hypothetical protein [Parapedobacter lycopersici]|uniref:hypothetical protein n=1 Tax=Parapedobacter lycopersici TaxID=1864939 RepID=UPI003340CD98
MDNNKTLPAFEIWLYLYFRQENELIFILVLLKNQKHQINMNEMNGRSQNEHSEQRVELIAGLSLLVNGAVLSGI